MELGRHLREIFRMRLAAAACLLLAVFGAVSMSYRIELDPPGLEPRSIEIASATAEVLVDKPLSTAVDLRQGATDFDEMTSRAALLGNVIATPPVVSYIARRANVPTAAIRAQPPVTPDFPRPIEKPGQESGAGSLLEIPDEHRINVQVDPSVPILRIIAQAPTAKAAETLASSAVAGLADYLDRIGDAQGTAERNRIRLEPLGIGRGVVVNDGVRLQASLIAFLVVFGVTAAAAIAVSRVRRGWREADAAEQAAAAGEPDGSFGPPAATASEPPAPALR